MSCQKIVTGGQTGVDRGFMDAALAGGVACGGWCPAGRLAEDGSVPLYYPLAELTWGGYEERTLRNVLDSDGTLILTAGAPAGGTLLTLRAAQASGKPCLVIRADRQESWPRRAHRAAAWVRRNHIGILNCAGPRAGEWPRGYQAAFRFGLILTGLFAGEACDSAE